jgi:HEAT repeat protein
MRETARRAIPTLNELVVEKTEPRDLRLDMITALQRVAQGTRASSAQLLQIADDPNENKNLRVGALQALASVGPDEEGVRILTNILKNTTGDLDLRRAAINPLMSQDTRAKEALPILRTILVNRSENSDLRAEAGQAIALTKSGSLEDSAALVMVVKDSEEPTELRSKIAYDLGILDPQSSGAATVLARIAADQQADLSLRRGTVDALRMIRRNGPGVIPALRNILYEHDADFQLRRSAVAAFGGIAADEKSLNAEAIPVLVDVIKHSDDPQMRQNAISYLGQMDPGSTELDRFLIQTAEDSQDDPTRNCPRSS